LKEAENELDDEIAVTIEDGLEPYTETEPISSF
jgi:hypothetical protein